MGWSRGSSLAQEAWDLVSQYVPKGKKQQIALKFARLFENEYAELGDGEADRLVADAGLEAEYFNEDDELEDDDFDDLDLEDGFDDDEDLEEEED